MKVLQGTDQWPTKGVLELGEQKWVFIPMGPRPTANRLRLKIAREWAFLTLIFAIGLLLVPGGKLWGLLVLYVTLCLFFGIVTLRGRYTRRVCVDLTKGELVLFYITFLGERGSVMIVLKWAEVTYRFKVTKGLHNWVLRINDPQYKLELRGNVYHERWTFNRFHKEQLDKMYELIKRK